MKRIMLLLMLAVFVPFLFGQIPQTISYQGILTDQAGNPKPDGSYAIIFGLYEVKTGGDPIWTETKNLNVSKGLFFTSLGDQTSFGSNVKFDKPYFLGIKIGDETELTPRIALTSTGYSFSSIYSDTTKNIVDGKVVESINGLKDNIKLIGDGLTTINTNGDTITISSSGGPASGIQKIENTNGTLDITNPEGSKTTINLKLPVSEAVTSNTAKDIVDGKVVKSLNGLKDNITLEGSGGTTVSKSGSKITISSSSGNNGIQEIKNTDGTINITNPTGTTTTLNLDVPLSLKGGAISPIITAENTGNGTGITGISYGSGYGVMGTSASGIGIYGSGKFYGVSGSATASSDQGFVAGVIGTSSEHGVYGTGGVAGLFGNTTSVQGKGVYGHNSANSTFADAVYGHSDFGIGVHGYSGGTAAGVYGKSESGYGVHAVGNGPFTAGIYAEGTNYAGIFEGAVKVNGTLIKTAGSFRIDHPLDPANKYLSHSFVESPDMMNIYNGNVTTDFSGSSAITLPDWFEALNKDFRYQLTVIGQFAQAIVESKIQNNQFRIKTDKPNVEVSWQVTGIRKDAYAEKNRIKIEEYKPEGERGKYLHPELFGQPREMGINYMKASEEPQSINLPDVPDLGKEKK